MITSGHEFFAAAPLCTVRRCAGRKIRYYLHTMFVVSFIPIVVAGAVAVLIGWVWYHPTIFGSAWSRMSGISPDMMGGGQNMQALMSFWGFVAAMVIAYVMSYFAIAWQVYDWIGALELAFWIWLGFVAPTMLTRVLWEQQPFRLYLINACYWYVTLSIMAVIVVVGLLFSAGVHSAQNTNDYDAQAYYQ